MRMSNEDPMGQIDDGAGGWQAISWLANNRGRKRVVLDGKHISHRDLRTAAGRHGMAVSRNVVVW